MKKAPSTEIATRRIRRNSDRKAARPGSGARGDVGRAAGPSRLAKPKLRPRHSALNPQTTMPQRIGRFRVLEEAGHGGMGIVYKAMDPENGRFVAIKRACPDRAGTENPHARFLEEAERMGQFDHPNIPKVLERGGSTREPYFTMEYLGGGRLDRRFSGKQGGTEEVLTAIYKLALAVQHVHENGWLHGDVKPANILTDDSGEPYLTDFGIARRLDGAKTADSEHEPEGTPLYMAPEQILSPTEADHRADIYALGLTMYELLTGVRPYRGSDAEEAISRILFWDPLPPRMLNPAITPGVEATILKAMAKDPRRRHQTAAELAGELKEHLVRIAINRRLHRDLTGADLPPARKN